MINDLKEKIIDSRLKHKLLDNLSDYQFNLEDAYNIQDEINNILSINGLGKIIGYKIGCTNKAIQKELNIIDDQYRAPTWADDLAWACIRIAELHKTGIYHISGPETFSIYELVTRVARYCGLDTTSLNKTTSESLNQAAKRPPKTGFDLSKSRNEIDYRPMCFEDSLKLLFSG